MFEGIYYSNALALLIESIAFHLFEEIGEVAISIIQTYTYVNKDPDANEYGERVMDLEDELADVLSWMFSLSIKLKMVFATFETYMKRKYSDVRLDIVQDIKLSSAISHKYCSHRQGGKLCCKMYCESAPCRCDIRVFSEEDKIRELIGKLSSQSPKAP